MKSLKITISILLLVGIKTFAQSTSTVTPKKNKGTIYFTWGYHRDTYTNSTIRFEDHTTDNYDFTFYHAKAKDKVDTDDFFHTPLTVPQYVMNIGYLFNNKRDLGIEVSWDHLKYVVIDNQLMHVQGHFRGIEYNQDIVVTPDFVHFEHTNGNNYLMVSLVKKQNLLRSSSRKHELNVFFKAGAGVLVPKTDSYIMGMHNDGPFRASGFVTGASANLRYNFFNYFYLEAGIKGAYANYTNAKLINDGRAHHSFFSVQYIGAAGINVPLGN